MNVPIKDGAVYDRTRILASMPTVNHALEQGAKVLLVSHLGRPKEGVFDEKLSLRPVVECLKDIVKEDVDLIASPRDPSVFNSKALKSIPRHWITLAKAIDKPRQNLKAPQAPYYGLEPDFFFHC